MAWEPTAAPMVMDISSPFDFNGKLDPTSPTSVSCETRIVGATVKGGPESGDTPTGEGAKTTAQGGWKDTRRVTVPVKIAILGRA